METIELKNFLSFIRMNGGKKREESNELHLWYRTLIEINWTSSTFALKIMKQINEPQMMMTKKDLADCRLQFEHSAECTVHQKNVSSIQWQVLLSQSETKRKITVILFTNPQSSLSFQIFFRNEMMKQFFSTSNFKSNMFNALQMKR